MAQTAKPMIHPTAVVSPGAKLHPSTQVGPFAVVGPRVETHSNVEIGSHSVLEGRVVLETGVRLSSHVCLGTYPQDFAYDGHEDSGVRIGAGSQIREFVTIHRASTAGQDTVVGEGCLLMVGCHVAHDCRVSDGVILTNYACLAGYSQVGARAVISSHCGIHQHCRVGDMAMIGALSKITQDVPPFAMVADNPARLVGLNKVGLRRAGHTAADLRSLQDGFNAFFLAAEATWTDRLARLASHRDSSPLVASLYDWLAQETPRGVLIKRS